MNKIGYKFWLGIIISFIFLSLAFRNIDWPKLGYALISVNFFYLALSVTFFVFNLWIRSLRWQYLLRTIKDVSAKDTLSYILIGHLANNLLPLRPGEIIRPCFLGAKVNMSKSTVLATTLVERIFDVLSLITFIVLLSLMMKVPPEFSKAIYTLEAIFALILIGILWINFFQARGEGTIFIKLEKLLPHRIGKGAKEIATSFFTGLKVVQTKEQLLAILIYSTLAWAMVALKIYFNLLACHLFLPWYAAIFLLLVLNFGSAIPSSPGFIGVVHYLAIFALSFWSIDKNEALSFAIILHGVTFGVTTLGGFVSLWRENLSFAGIGKAGTEIPISSN